MITMEIWGRQPRSPLLCQESSRKGNSHEAEIADPFGSHFEHFEMLKEALKDIRFLEMEEKVEEGVSPLIWPRETLL